MPAIVRKMSANSCPMQVVDKIGGTDAGSLLVQCRHAFLPLDFVLGGHVHSLENTRSPEVKARIFAAGMPKDV
jgi:hypothetical protein